MFLIRLIFCVDILQENLIQSTTESKSLSGGAAAAAAAISATVAVSATVSANNSAATEKVSNATNPSTGYGTSKKEEIKIVPAVVPVLGYTAAPPNIYQPPMESGIQFVTGAQQTQPTSFSTTYQQGVRHSKVC